MADTKQLDPLAGIPGYDSFGQMPWWREQQGENTATGEFNPQTVYAKPDTKTSSGTYTGGKVDPNNDDPEALASQLIRAQFAEWESMFKPIELQAIQNISYNNPAVLTKAVDTARESAIGTSDAMQGIIERRNRSQGVVSTEPQTTATKRILDINKSMSIAGAENTARSTQRALDEQILLGTTPSPQIVNPNR